MDISQYLMILIPYNEKDEIEKQQYTIGDRDHRSFCQKIIEKYNMNHSGGESHIDYATTFTENRYVAIFSSGAKVDGKFFATIFLPEEMSAFQIDFLLNTKQCFNEKYHELINFFSTLVYTTETLPYNSGYKNFRSLEIEAIINQNPNAKNCQILLYEELDRRKKEMLKR